MAKEETVQSQKRRGPVATGQGTQVQVRLQPDQLAALDAWAKSQDAGLSRPEAIRQLIAMGLADRRQKPR